VTHRDRGFATSGAYVVVGLAALLALGSLYTAAANTTETVADTREETRERTAAVTAADVTVAATYNTTTGGLTVRATNTGERALRVDRTDLVVDGRYVGLAEVDAVSVAGRTDPTVWRPGEDLVVTDAREAPDRVKLVAERGTADATIVTTVS